MQKLALIYLFIVGSLSSLNGQKITGNSCNTPILITDSTQNTKIISDKIYVKIEFANKKTSKTINLPCEEWEIYVSDESCDSVKEMSIFSKSGNLIINQQKIEKGFCNCYFCSWKQRTFDSIPKPFYIRGTNCEGNITILKKNKINNKLPLWLQKEYHIGEIFNLNNILFLPNKSIFVKDSFEELDYLFQLLTQQKQLKIQITGHVNAPKQKNTTEFQELSENRAKAVVEYLIEKGISPQRLSFKGFGNTKMLHENPKTISEMTENRRVEITVM